MPQEGQVFDGQKRQFFNKPGAANCIVPRGAQWARVTLQGAGASGGGGGTVAQNTVGGAGSSGSKIDSAVINVADYAILAVNVGQGGAAAAPQAAGANGQATTLQVPGGPLLTAAGGLAGAAGAAAAGAPGAAPGLPDSEGGIAGQASAGQAAASGNSMYGYGSAGGAVNAASLPGGNGYAIVEFF